MLLHNIYKPYWIIYIFQEVKSLSTPDWPPDWPHDWDKEQAQEYWDYLRTKVDEASQQVEDILNQELSDENYTMEVLDTIMNNMSLVVRKQTLLLYVNRHIITWFARYSKTTHLNNPYIKIGGHFPGSDLTFYNLLYFLWK